MNGASVSNANLQASNSEWARSRFPLLSDQGMEDLKFLTSQLKVSGRAGDITFFDDHWYVTHAGLLRIAATRKCVGIITIAEQDLSNPARSSWVFKAIVYKSRSSKGFMGYGDANPSNVSPKVYGSEMRIAETRAVNRALRKAYAIGICSYEELGPQGSPNGNGHKSVSDAKPVTLRERLCALVSEHGLNASAVKRYAADFCGTQELRDASRELVEDFIYHFSEALSSDREALLSKLNQYAVGGAQ